MNLAVWLLHRQMTFARYMPRADLNGLFPSLYPIGGFMYELILYVTFPPLLFPIQTTREQEKERKSSISF